MKGTSLTLPGSGLPVQILPQQRAPHLSSASTSCSTTLSSHFQPCRRVRQNSSHSRRSSPRALKQQRPRLKENFKDAFNLYPRRQRHRPPGDYPSIITQLPTALGPQFPSVSVAQSKTRDLNAPGNLEQTTSSSALGDVQPGSKASSKPERAVSMVTEHRESLRAIKSTSDQRVPIPNNGRPAPRFETGYMLGKRRLPGRSNRIPSSHSNPNSSNQIEALAESKNDISSQTVWRSPHSGAHSISNSYATRMSYGRRGRRVELADGVVDQARSSQNGANLALKKNWHMHSAGTTSEAIATLQNRLRGIASDSFTFIKVLQMCLQRKDLVAAKQVHDCIIESGMDKNPYVASTLLNVYIKCGGMLDARRFFDELEKKTVITWNSMIAGYTKSDRATSAFELFKLMRQEGVRPNEVTYLSILKACASPSALKWGKEVHMCIRNSGHESDARVGTALLQMYAKSGCITEARRVFENLTSRNILTWNLMLGAYAERGHGLEAYGLFLEMRREGFEPDAFTYVSILNASASVGALDWVKEVHDHARKDGLELDLRVGSALVHMYAKIGSIDNARLVFDRMGRGDVVTWNIMIGGLAQHGCGHESYRLFLEMRRKGFEPTAFTYTSILNPSVSVGGLDWVKEVHGHACEDGLESDLRVGSALVRMYAKSGSIDDSRMVFDRMKKRDLITWNIMIGSYAESGHGLEAYNLFLQMRREGFKANAVTYTSILNSSASVESLDLVKEVHGHARKDGLELDLRVGSALVHMYAKSGSIDDSRMVFDRMEKRDVLTWSVMIGGLAQSGCGHEAYRMFLQMKQDGFEPNEFTYTSILNASASSGALDWVKEVHAYALKEGLESDLHVCNAFVHMYAKSGSIDDSRLVFDRIKKRDLITWNIMIGSYAESGRGIEAYELFLQMQREGYEPDAFTYASILNASATAEALEWVKKVHDHARKAGLELDLRVGSALVHMYANSGWIDDAAVIFDRMEKRDVVTWTVMIGGFAQHGRGRDALELFRKMIVDGVKPNAVSFVAVLSACCHGGLVDDGHRFFSAMTRDYGIEADIIHYNCMVDLLGRAGRLKEAKQFISDMPLEPNVVTWTTLLGACRTYGNVELGELAANKLFKLEPSEASTYVLLSNIYAAAGKWEKVSLVRSMMQKRGVRKEPGRSWIEVDNKIHEFVVGDTSHPEANAIYTELKKVAEKLKAEGYIPDTRLVLQDIAEEDKELALCSHSEKLAIAYGLMHLPPGQAIRVRKNLRVCADCHTATKLISKVAGREIIARDANRFHHFKDGLCSCGDYW